MDEHGDVHALDYCRSYASAARRRPAANAPVIFSGYHNSNVHLDGFGFDDRSRGWGGAFIFVPDQDELGIGETGLVHMHVYGESPLAEELRVGVPFSLYEGGRRVANGTITALLEGPPDTLQK